ncbi:MAG: hypothetical protein ACI9C3_002516, partial [Yoonia sp.]
MTGRMSALMATLLITHLRKDPVAMSIPPNKARV